MALTVPSYGAADRFYVLSVKIFDKIVKYALNVIKV